MYGAQGMYQIDEKFLKKLLRDTSRSIVGRLCKQNEVLQDHEDISDNQKLKILKSFQRELIYEAFRDLENALKIYMQGKDYEKFKIYRPKM